MESGSHGVGGQLAGHGDLVVAQPPGLAHEEDVAVQRRQPVERVAQHGGELLRRRRRTLGKLDGNAAPPIVHVLCATCCVLTCSCTCFTCYVLTCFLCCVLKVLHRARRGSRRLHLIP